MISTCSTPRRRKLSRVIKTVPGAADVQVKSPPGAPRIAVKLRPDRLAAFGFRPVEVLEAIQTAYQGTVVAQSYQGNRVSDVAVILDEPARRAPEQIGSLMLRSAQGLRLPLRELADVYLTSGRHSILHDGARRRQTITCNSSGRDVASFASEAKSQMEAKVAFPSGVYAVFSGAAKLRRPRGSNFFFTPPSPA